MQTTMEPRLLLVDDDEIILQTVLLYFKRSGVPYQFMIARNGKQAAGIALEECPDIIITDWEMPEMNGLELIKFLKARPETQDIPIIMASGAMVSAANLKEALDAGAVDFLRKPIDGMELLARTHSAIKLAASYRQLKQQQQRLELALEGGQLGTWHLDIPRQVIVADKRYVSMLGLPAERLTFPIEEARSWAHPDDLKQSENAIQKHLSGVTPLYMFECRIRAVGETYRWLGYYGKVVERDEGGEPLMLAGVVQDVTERKRMESLQQQYDRDMLRALVQGQDQARSQIAGQLHEDVAQNLTGVIFQLNQIQAQPQLLQASDVLVEVIQTLNDNVRHLRLITHSLLPRVLEDFGLAAALERYAETMEAHTGIEVSVDVEPLPDLEPALQRHLYSLVQMLISEAVRRDGATYVYLQIFTHAGNLRLLLEEDGPSHSLLREYDEARKSIEARLSILGGLLQVVENNSRGSMVRLEVPLEAIA